MRQRRALAIAAAVILLLAALATMVSLSALPEPSAAESYAATAAKNWLIARAAWHSPPPAPPPRDAATLAAGAGLYGMECAFCHGQDPHTLAPIAHSMYPRALNLSSAAVQARSDAQLFWVIKHGIRLSAMPGFAPINSDPEIWKLTFFVRSLDTSAH